HLFEARVEECTYKGAVPELRERHPLRLIAGESEHRVEGAIARLDALVSAQHDERISDCVEDRLRAFTFIDGLSAAGAERCHIGERQHSAADAIAFRARGYPDNEPFFSEAKISPGFHSIGNDLAALLFEPGQASKRRDIARRPANVRFREAKHLRRGSIK